MSQQQQQPPYYGQQQPGQGAPPAGMQVPYGYPVDPNMMMQQQQMGMMPPQMMQGQQMPPQYYMTPQMQGQPPMMMMPDQTPMMMMPGQQPMMMMPGQQMMMPGQPPMMMMPDQTPMMMMPGQQPMMMMPGQPMMMPGQPMMVPGQPMYPPGMNVVLNNLAADEVKICVHGHPLKTMNLGQLKMFNSKYSSGADCRGKGFYGCRTWGKNPSLERDNPADIIYHCADCEYDLCEKCYNFYGNKSHGHLLQRMTFNQVHQMHGIDYNVWACDKTLDKKDCTKKHISSNEDLVFYCQSCDFVICQVCYETFKKFS